ncbi:MAG TPA: hypothetical protein VMQ56_17925 [Terracidiphilus sp.]|jgi:hypothetical protein|nr:hypothetical protein [Terracidiphilus sp.]
MRLLRSERWLMLALLVCLIPASLQAGVFVSVNFGPPVLPVYEQPICPAPNLMWTPGYWGYGPDGYYWIPGAWVPSPFVGGLWTPGYWGWGNGLYIFHPGYWGYHVGYYGGVNYGFGYGGIGFAGGEWRHGAFAYNTAVMHVDERIVHTTYVDRTVVERGYVARDSHVAYSGGPGGIRHAPNAQEQTFAHEQHVAPTAYQTQHMNSAQADRTSYVKNNGGHPANLAASRPLAAEAHTAPAVSHGAVSAGRPASTAYAPHSNTSAPVHTNTSAPVHTNTSTPVHATPTAPAHTTAPPRTNAAPARPAPAPKQEGHPK